MALIKDINIVCSTLKAFLRLLDEPLVTYSQRPKFLAAAEQVNRGPERARYQVTTLLQRLPIPAWAVTLVLFSRRSVYVWY